VRLNPANVTTRLNYQKTSKHCQTFPYRRGGRLNSGKPPELVGGRLNPRANCAKLDVLAPPFTPDLDNGKDAVAKAAPAATHVAVDGSAIAYS
jgi:hypothetical protein